MLTIHADKMFSDADLFDMFSIRPTEGNGKIRVLRKRQESNAKPIGAKITPDCDIVEGTIPGSRQRIELYRQRIESGQELF